MKRTKTMITTWEAFTTADVAMLNAGIDPVKRTEVLEHMRRITEAIENGTEKRLQERREQRTKQN